MKNSARFAILLASASLCLTAFPDQAMGQELNAEAKSKEAVEARAKRNAQIFQNNASILTFLDRYGKPSGQIGERAMYESAVLSPDGKRVATIKDDLENESADLWVFDVATGAATRFTTSARREFADSPVWSPDSSRLAYTLMRKGQEAIYVRAASGQGAEELLYKNPGAFMNLSDWSSDGRFRASPFPTLSKERSTFCRSRVARTAKPSRFFTAICASSGRVSLPTAATSRMSCLIRPTDGRFSSVPPIPRSTKALGRFPTAASNLHTGSTAARNFTM